MLNRNLLLDSARSLSVKASDVTYDGCPQHGSAGVLSSCPDSPQPSRGSEALRWYALRVTYSRELKVQATLQERGVRTFIPMMWKTQTRNGKRTRSLVPAVNNLCFVHWDRKSIYDFIGLYGENGPVHFYWDRTVGAPLEVPAKAMEDFITVASAIDLDIVYIREVSEKFRAGQTVTVLDGPFKGVTGKVIRVKKSRRVLVELPGILAAATAYINPQSLELKTEE